MEFVCFIGARIKIHLRVPYLPCDVGELRLESKGFSTSIVRTPCQDRSKLSSSVISNITIRLYYAQVAYCACFGHHVIQRPSTLPPSRPLAYLDSSISTAMHIQSPFDVSTLPSLPLTEPPVYLSTGILPHAQSSAIEAAVTSQPSWS